MSMEPGERRTFNCVIKSKAQEQDGYKLELEVAEFRSNYPTTITRVPETLASILEPGNSYPLVLERQNLKKNKDRSKPYNWYWGLVDLGNSLADGPSDVTYEPIFDETPGEAERSTFKQPAPNQPIDLVGARITASWSITNAIEVQKSLYPEIEVEAEYLAGVNNIATRLTNMQLRLTDLIMKGKTAQVPAEDKGGE